jgi:hypothetical protein
MASEFDMPADEIKRRLTTTEKVKRVGTDTGLTPRQANAITQARLQYALSELADMNVDNVHQWLNEVGARNPAEAVRLFMELLEFRLPRLKAAQVVANLTPTAEGQRKLATMTIAELEQIVAEG